MNANEVTVTRFYERFTKCASCRSDARWMVSSPTHGRTTTCDRHRETWVRRAASTTTKES
jgi:hypothetical protein